MSRRTLVKSLVVVGLIILVVAVLWHTRPAKPSPQRAETAVQVAESVTPVPSPLVIEPTAIVNIRIPSVNIDAGMSGETWPRESPRCHGAPTCIDPPELKMAAWYGAYALPSYPSEDSVLIFGHSNWKNPDQQVFNNLPAVKAGDAVIVTTENAEFMYRANDPVLENYETIHPSELVYGHVPNRIVLVTCNDKEQAATVVTADLVEAKPL